MVEPSIFGGTVLHSDCIILVYYWLIDSENYPPQYEVNLSAPRHTLADLYIV